jgi:dGTPase
MGWTDENERYKRRHTADPVKKGDQRRQGAPDRDRILHSSSFRRLDGVTQVADPLEGVLHNRLTHSLKVAQIARRLAEYAAQKCPAEVSAQGGVDPEIADAAGLAHDIGHPPFGHVTDHTLDGLLKQHGCLEGFEGNAQSFRVLTSLAIRRTEHRGLDLSRAALCAVTKYPWARDQGGEQGKRAKKWGFYKSEEADFVWSRQYLRDSENQTLEAALMDLADDIAYSVHDAEDFYRAGLVPLDQLSAVGSAEHSRFSESIPEPLRKPLEGVLITCPVDEPYQGTQQQRAKLRTWTSTLIQRFLLSVEISRDDKLPVIIPQDRRDEIEALKKLTRHYVIDRASLRGQQRGHRKIVEDLFAIYHEAIVRGEWELLPPRFGEELRGGLGTLFHDDMAETQRQARLAADIIACMTDTQALKLHQRLTGANPGAFADSYE